MCGRYSLQEALEDSTWNKTSAFLKKEKEKEPTQKDVSQEID